MTLQLRIFLIVLGEKKYLLNKHVLFSQQYEYSLKNTLMHFLFDLDGKILLIHDMAMLQVNT